MSRPIKTSVVGSGLAARVFHVPLVLAHPSLFQLYSVVERSPTSDKPEGTIAHAFNIKTKLVNRYEDVTNDPEVELVRQGEQIDGLRRLREGQQVIIGTPPSTHYEIAKVMVLPSNRSPSVDD
jgi:predicted dehydrogenase